MGLKIKEDEYIPEDIIRLGEVYLNLSDDDKKKTYLFYIDGMADYLNGYRPDERGMLYYKEDNRPRNMRIDIKEDTIMTNGGYSFRKGGLLFGKLQSNGDIIPIHHAIIVATTQDLYTLYKKYKGTKELRSKFLFELFNLINAFQVIIWRQV